MKGYKAFNQDWTCLGKQYEVGKEYTEDGPLELCGHGMHFCERLIDCFDFYKFRETPKIAAVEAVGEIKTDGKKACTNRLRILREVPWEEVLRLCNTGDWNTGNCNTGDWNTGYWNTGNRNTGDCNTGNRNTGDCNTGNRNTGNWNTGDWNTGNCNTGDWNTGNCNTGIFCTEMQKINCFDKPSSWTIYDWWQSGARDVLDRMPQCRLIWIPLESMTAEQKKQHKSAETVGGFLKLEDHIDRQKWWESLSERERQYVLNLPNFDTNKFKAITGIQV